MMWLGQVATDVSRMLKETQEQIADEAEVGLKPIHDESLMS